MKGVRQRRMERFLWFVGIASAEMVQSSGKAQYRELKGEVLRSFWKGPNTPEKE
jgi:hypothetical protein